EQRAEAEAEDGAQREPDRSFLRGEECRVEEDRDELRADAARPRARPERLEDAVQVRHRRLVDDERPGPRLAHPEPAVALPEPPEHAEDEREQHRPADAAAYGDGSRARTFERDRRHGTC